MMADRLNRDQSPSTNQYLLSNNSKDIIAMQSGGNLVIYEVLADGGRRALWWSETPTPDPFAVIPPPEAFADFPDEGRVSSSGIERSPCRGGTIMADERSDEARPG